MRSRGVGERERERDCWMTEDVEKEDTGTDGRREDVAGSHQRLKPGNGKSCGSGHVSLKVCQPDW